MTMATREKPSRTDRARRPTSRRRILVASTGEGDSRGALRLAGALCARSTGTTVLALGVSTPAPIKVSAYASLNQPVSVDERSRRDVLESLRRAVQPIPGSETWEKKASIGMPADEINRVASHWGASLIILGLRHHSRFDRLLGSDTAIAVIRHANIPVLAVPASERTSPQHALAAMDFTDASVAAARLATELVSKTGTLTVAHVCGFAGVTSKPGDLVDLYRAGANAKLEEVVRTLRRQSACAIDSVLLDGEPASALLGYARRQHCDLIALGGHALGLIDRIVLGSIRTKVVRGATGSVLIAPPSDATP